MMNMADLDGDGKVNFIEFCKIIDPEFEPDLSPLKKIFGPNFKLDKNVIIQKMLESVKRKV